MAIDYGGIVFSLPSVSKTQGQKTINFYREDMVTHTIMAGTVGSGKSQIILRLLRQIFKRIARGSNDVVVLTDSGGEFTKVFFDERHCHMLNPLDMRSQTWDLFSELVDPVTDSRMLAENMVQEDPNPKNKVWTDYARTLLSSCMHVVKRDLVTKKLQNIDPVDYLITMLNEFSKEQLEGELTGTPAMGLLKGKETEGLAITRSTLMPTLESLALFKGQGNFSIRTWLSNVLSKENDSNEKRVLFIPYMDLHMSLLKNTIGAWLNLVSKQVMSSGASRERTVWVICDELDSLGKVSSLEEMLARGRKYGFNFLGAIQSVGQLRKTYGRESAQTILSTTNTKIILKQGSYEDADYWSRDIGDHLAKKKSAGMSAGKDVSLSSNVSTQREALIPASDFRQIEKFGAFILKNSSPGKIIRYRSAGPFVLEDIAPTFIEKQKRTYETEFASQVEENVVEQREKEEDDDEDSTSEGSVDESPEKDSDSEGSFEEYRRERDQIQEEEKEEKKKIEIREDKEDMSGLYDI